MAPSSNPPPSNQSHPSPLNALLQKKAQEARDAKAMGLTDVPEPGEKQGAFRHAVVDILPRPKTKMNRPQNAETFEEGDYCPIEPARIKQKKTKAERVQRRQKLVIQKRRIKKRRRVFLKRLKRFSNLMAFFMLSVMIWVLLVNPMWTFHSNQPVVLHNARFITEEQLAPILKPYNHFSMYQMDPRTIESRAKKRYPIIEHLYVRRSLFPARLDITIIEKTPFAAIYDSAQSKLPTFLATFESDTNRYDVIARAPYTFTKNHQQVLPKLVIPKGYKIDQNDWQRIDSMLSILRQNKTLPLIAVELLPLSKTKQNQINLGVIAHYHGFIVLAGNLDVELAQRISRLAVLIPKIQEMKQQIQGVDLRWSEQITFLKKDSPLPPGMSLWNPNPKKPERNVKGQSPKAGSTDITKHINILSKSLATPFPSMGQSAKNSTPSSKPH